MTLSPVRVWLLLILTFLGQSSALAHVCAWSAMEEAIPQVHAQPAVSSKPTVTPCHEQLQSEAPAKMDSEIDSGHPSLEFGHLCMCASGGCATAAAVTADYHKAAISLTSIDYPALVEHALTPALTTPLRPPSFA